MWFANIFFQFIGYFFILLMVSFSVQKLFTSVQSHLFIFAFFPELLVLYPKKIADKANIKELLLYVFFLFLKGSVKLIFSIFLLQKVDGYLSFFFFFLTSLLEYNCFTLLCQLLLCNKVNQLYVYIYPHIPSLLHLPPTPLGGHNVCYLLVLLWFQVLCLSL